MIGAIIGDIVGSRFEFNNHRSTEFEFFHPQCDFTDEMRATALGLLPKEMTYVVYRMYDHANR